MLELHSIEFLWGGSIVHLNFHHKTDMCRVFLRFQEYYESPRFADTFFRLDEFAEWYKTTRNGKFTYYTDWAGFNFPHTVVDAFLPGGVFADDLNEEEQALVNLLLLMKKPYYVIGTCMDTFQVALEHEKTHALYFLNENYRKKVNEILAEADKKLIDTMHDYLNPSYHPKNFLDETNAYIATDYKAFARRINVDEEGFKTHQALSEVREEYMREVDDTYLRRKRRIIGR